MKDFYYDKYVNAISREEYSRLMKDNEYKKVALTNLPDGKRVSTVWLGINYNFTYHNPPLMFETMVFPQDSWGELDCDRYCSELMAIFGHVKMVRKWKK